MPTRFEPPDGKTLLMIGQNIPATEEYIQAIGKVPAGAMTYFNIQEPESGLVHPWCIDPPAGCEELAGEYPCPDNSQQLLKMHFPYWNKHYQNFVVQAGLDLVSDECLLQIVDKKFDGNIKEIADAFKAVDMPIFLRVGYEVNRVGKKYPYGDYIPACRYFHCKMKENEVDNVAFVWHVTAGPCYQNDSGDCAMKWYPGDDFVDWVAVSFFSCEAAGSVPPSSAVYKDNMSKIIEFAQDRGKPLMVAESSPLPACDVKHGRGSWEQFFAPLFDLVEQNDFKVLCYINQNWTCMGWKQGSVFFGCDSRVQDNTHVKEQWLLKTASDRYVQSSPGLYEMIGFKPRA